VARVSGVVTQVEFTHDGATLVSAGSDGTRYCGAKRYWDVQSGEAKSVLEGIMFAFAKGKKVVPSTQKDSMFVFSKGFGQQKVGKFLITVKDDILRIFKSEDGVTDKSDKDTVTVVFFRVPAWIKTFDTSGAYIVVGCYYGLLHLRAAVQLTDV
jgi:hypothetical protein